MNQNFTYSPDPRASRERALNDDENVIFPLARRGLRGLAHPAARSPWLTCASVAPGGIGRPRLPRPGAIDCGDGLETRCHLCERDVDPRTGDREHTESTR